MTNRRVLGSAALIGSAFLWATAYLYVKQLVENIPPCLLLALRFSLAAIVLAILFIPKWKQLNKGLVAAGIRMGIALFFEFFFFTVGIQYTTASKSSFIIASYIILLPIVYFIIRRKKPGRLDVFCSVLCMAGLCLLLADNLNGFNKGDLLSVFCAISYAVHVVYSSQYAKKYDGGLLNLIQLATSAVLSIAVTLIMGDFRMAVITQVPVRAVVYLAVICTILPYFLCLFGMKYVSTATSGILLSFESVFATSLAVVLMGERLYWQLVAGGAIIIASFFVSELWPDKEKRKRQIKEKS